MMSVVTMKTLASALLVILLVTLVASCNTISGAGRDVSATGQGVSSGANAVKHSIQN